MLKWKKPSNSAHLALNLFKIKIENKFKSDVFQTQETFLENIVIALFIHILRL
jgi:hypothetical protein